MLPWGLVQGKQGTSGSGRALGWRGHAQGSTVGLVCAAHPQPRASQPTGLQVVAGKVFRSDSLRRVALPLAVALREA